MFELDSSERAFVERRARFAKRWPLAGGLSIAILAGLAIWLWFSVPALVDPWFVMAGLEAESIPETTIVMMAAMLPVAVLLCLVVVLVCVLFAFAAFSNERRLIAIIRRCSQD